MRKILLSLFIVNILLSFFIFHDLENNRINNHIIESGEEQATTILVDKAINSLDRTMAIDKIIATTKKYQADIILNVYNNAPGQKFNLIKYIYLKDSSKLFEKLKVTGNILGNYDRSNSYLDSRDCDDKECIGRIGVLDNNFKIRISTLENLKNEKYVLSGYYSVNIAKERTDTFLRELGSELKVDISRVNDMNQSRTSIPPILKIIPMTIVFLLAILVVLIDLISRFKDVGVKKLNGYSNRRLKLEYYRDIGVLYFMGAVASYSFLGLLSFKFKSSLYLDLILKSLIITSLLFFVVCLVLLIPLKYMDKITIASAVKNMKPVQFIRGISDGFKAVFILILIGLFIYAMKLYLPIYNFYFENLSQIAVIFGIAGITIAILIAYSIMIYMEKEKMELSIKLLNGYGFLDRHGKKLIHTMCLYIIFLPTLYFVRNSMIELGWVVLLLVSIMLLDLLVSIILINIYEKRNIKDILKGN